MESFQITFTTFLLAAAVSAFVAVVIHLMGFLIKKFSPAVKVPEIPVAVANKPALAASSSAASSDTEIVAAIMAVKKFARK